jgi:hypothetical protein
MGSIEGLLESSRENKIASQSEDRSQKKVYTYVNKKH